MRVHCYWTPSRQCITIRNARNRKVIGRDGVVFLNNVKFVVNVKGFVKERETGKHVLHAWVEGEYLPEKLDGFAPDRETLNNGIRVVHDIRHGAAYYAMRSGKHVSGAAKIIYYGEKIYAYNPTYIPSASSRARRNRSNAPAQRPEYRFEPYIEQEDPGGVAPIEDESHRVNVQQWREMSERLTRISANLEPTWHVQSLPADSAALDGAFPNGSEPLRSLFPVSGDSEAGVREDGGVGNPPAEQADNGEVPQNPPIMRDTLDAIPIYDTVIGVDPSTRRPHPAVGSYYYVATQDLDPAQREAMRNSWNEQHAGWGAPRDWGRRNADGSPFLTFLNREFRNRATPEETPREAVAVPDVHIQMTNTELNRITQEATEALRQLSDSARAAEETNNGLSNALENIAEPEECRHGYWEDEDEDIDF